MANRHDIDDRGGGTEPDPDRVRQILAAAAQPSARPSIDATGDPETARQVKRQQRVSLLLSGGGPRASDELRARIDTLGVTHRARAPRAGPRPVARGWLAGGALVAAGVAAGAVAVVGLGGGQHASTVSASRVAAVWRLPAQRPAPTPDRRHPRVLSVALHGTRFPNYHDDEGWHPSGARRQRVDGGAAALTVYYRTGARHATYTVVHGTRVSIPRRASRFTADGRRVAEYRAGGTWVIAFRDHGNTCVLAAAAPRERRWLVKLAAWRDGSSV